MGSNVVAGQQVATVRNSTDPAAQNNGIAHIHFEAFNGSTCYAGTGEAFSGVWRLQCAKDLPYNATYGFYIGTPISCELDGDNDDVSDAKDNCPLVGNPDQADTDKDGKGDVCDPDFVVVDGGADMRGVEAGRIDAGNHDGGAPFEFEEEVLPPREGGCTVGRTTDRGADTRPLAAAAIVLTVLARRRRRRAPALTSK
jgi:hypothetical protein